MSSSGASPGRGDQVHRGHDLEAGVLQRVREWTDVFPWVRLGRVMRVAGSPQLLMIVAIALAVWASSLEWFDGDSPARPAAQTHVSNAAGDVVVIKLRRAAPRRLAELVLPPKELSWPARIWRLVWSLVIWTPVALLLIRQGALLCAGRGMVGITDGATQSLRRTPAAWLVGLLPLVGVILVGLPILVIGWWEQAASGVTWLEPPLAMLVALIAIPCGLLGFGALIAVPLGWAAIINEPAPDALESLSRGYEYLYRRPLQLVMYACICLVIGVILWLLLQGVTEAASWIAEGLLRVTNSSSGGENPSGGIAEWVVWLLHFLPTIALITLSWGLVGGVYLLLRQDAGGQEVEDLWQPAANPQQPLPSLSNTADLSG